MRLPANPLPAFRPYLMAVAAAGIVLVAVSASRSPASAPPASTDGAVPRDDRALRFWDRYVSFRDLRRRDPASAAKVAEEQLKADPDHFLAAWLRGQLAATTPGDSVARRQLLAQAEREPRAAGLQVSAATVLYAGQQSIRGRAVLGRAHEGYLAAGRRHDACRALLWRLVLARGSQVGPEVLADVRAAEAAARALDDPEVLADVLLVRAEMEYRQSAQDALRTRLEAMALLTGLPPGHQLIECHRHLSNAYKTLGELRTARHHADRALELARSLGYARQELMALRALAHVDRAEGALNRAYSEQIRAAEMARVLREMEILARCYGDLGNLARELGRYRAAAAAYVEGLRCVGADKADPGFRAMILVDLAATNCLMGNYRDARTRYEEALDVCRARGLDLRTPTILAGLAELHLDTGEPERAVATATEGAAVAGIAGNRGEQISLLLLQSRALEELGHDADALAAARAARLLARDGVPRLLWDVMRREAATLFALDRAREADALLDSTIGLFAQLPDTLELAATLRLQGELRERDSDPIRALPLLLRSRDLLDQLRDPVAAARTRLVLGRSLLATGRASEAIAELESGLGALETVRASFGTTGDRVGYASAWYPAYADLARAQLAEGRPAAAFAALERGRGRGLREALVLADGALTAHVPGELGESLADVAGELGGLQSALRAEYARDPQERSAGTATMEQRADSLKTVWSDLARQAERESPSFAREMDRTPKVTARDIQSALAPDERLIAYQVGRDATLVFTFFPGRLSVREIPWGERRLARRVDDFVTTLRSGESQAWRAAATALADTLLGVEAVAEPDARALYVLPDGALHLLPFEALLVASPAGGQRVHLVELAPIVYASSATLLLRPGPEPAARAGNGADLRLAAFGDPVLDGGDGAAGSPAGELRGGPLVLRPLPNARREVATLAELIPGTRAIVGAEATEERFWSEAARARMIHVASHAFVDDRHPEFSGVVLSPRDGTPVEGMDDGILQAYEIAAHSLDVDLVTLSACETGVGRLRRGEGLLSLGRAFRLMGARNLVVSLWDVDDATTLAFMTEFYRRLAGGEPIPAALRGAKLALLRSGTAAAVRDVLDPAAVSRGITRRPVAEQLATPAAWAPFVLLGERVR